MALPQHRLRGPKGGGGGGGERTRRRAVPGPVTVARDRSRYAGRERSRGARAAGAGARAEDGAGRDRRRHRTGPDRHRVHRRADRAALLAEQEGLAGHPGGATEGLRRELVERIPTRDHAGQGRARGPHARVLLRGVHGEARVAGVEIGLGAQDEVVPVDPRGALVRELPLLDVTARPTASTWRPMDSSGP